MLRVLLVLAVVALVVYALVELVQADADCVRTMPKWLWAVVILAAPGVGALAWLVWGRPGPGRPGRTGRRPVAPDDDPDFLRGL